MLTEGWVHWVNLDKSMVLEQRGRTREWRKRVEARMGECRTLLCPVQSTLRIKIFTYFSRSWLLTSVYANPSSFLILTVNTKKNWEFHLEWVSGNHPAHPTHPIPNTPHTSQMNDLSLSRCSWKGWGEGEWPTVSYGLSSPSLSNPFWLWDVNKLVM